MTTARRYNSTSLGNMVEELKSWTEQTQDTLDNAESQEYPNDNRIETLSNRMDALQAAIDSLEEIESN